MHDEKTVYLNGTPAQQKRVWDAFRHEGITLRFPNRPLEARLTGKTETVYRDQAILMKHFPKSKSLEFVDEDTKELLIIVQVVM